ncbi:MAG: ATP-binding protein [Candidatus Margulisiibacteriota bacterium]
MLKKILFASFLGMVVFSFLFVGILSVPEIKSAVINHLAGDLYRQAQLSKDGYAKLLRQTSDRLVIQNAALKTAALSGSRVTIIAKNGTVLGDSDTLLKDLPKLENHADRSEIISAASKGIGRSVRHSHTLGKDLIYLAIPLKNSTGGALGFLRFAIPISYASGLMLGLYKSILIVLIAVAALAAGLSFFFARFFSAPIEKLIEISELKKLEHYRSEFVANVSHELKTPLATIHSYVQTLSAGAINDPQHNLDFLGKIDKHVLRLSVLIDDILEISQLESKEGLTPFSKVNIIETAERAVDAVAERCAKKKVMLKKEFASADYSVLGLEDHIYRAILNLLENALTYTAEGGGITVAGAKQNDKVVVSVADTGIGISAEHLPRIFERFYRVDQARSRQLGGTGLGLAIVKHVMHIHNGTVTVESEVGKGSKFTLIFPC